MITITEKSFWFLFAVSMFLSSVAYTVFLTTDNNKGYRELPTTETVYNTQLEIPKEVLWTGAQVVGKLYRLTENDYPIVVGTEEFNTDEDVKNKQNFIQLQGLYKLDTILNSEGNIQRIVFTYQP